MIALMTVPSFTKMKREEELKSQGWTKRFMIDEPRLSEAVAEYEEIGFEVLLEPLDLSALSSEECTSCISALSDCSKTIYTRPKK